MITIYNSNLDFDLDSSNSITLSSTSNMVFKTNGVDKMSIVNNGISVSGNVVVSGLITSTGAGFSGIGANLTNIPISAINELRLELNGSTTDLAVTSNVLVSRLVSEIGFGSNYTNRINSELNTRVDNTSNYVLATSNILIGRIINTSNYVDSTSNFLSGRLDNTSNYVFATSNILIGRLINTSNYVDNTSNFLSGRLDNTSNYVFATSNILIGRIINTSNYVDSTSNFLGVRIDNTSNYALATSNILIGRVINASNYVESTSNILIGRLINTSNYVDSTSNFLGGRIDNTSNYVFATSNILIGRLINTSNYVDNTSNFLGGRIDNTSNYVFATSNILIGRLINTSNYVDSTSNFLGGRIDNTSNYVFSTSNILVAKANLNDSNSSNYVNSTSNILVAKANFNDSNSSNYVDSTSNILVGRVMNTCNYVLSTSNILVAKANFNDLNASNYVFSTSNVISKRITDLTTDMIYEDPSATKKFIINNRYNNNLLVNGDLTINSNLIVLGESTTLETIVYTTERMEIVNANNTSTALMIQQKDNFRDILVASNLTTNAFNVANNGDVNIIGNYKKNNRDVIDDTSNYVRATSNILIGRVVHTSNYVSSYKPATAVRADTADKFTTSRRIANIPFDGSDDINISYSDLNNQLSFGNGLTTSYDNTTKITSVSATTETPTSANLISIFNTPNDFVNNVGVGKIELSKNTSNYVFATSNILIGRVINTSNYIESVNTTLTTAMGLKQNTINSTANQIIIGNGNGITTTSVNLTFNSSTNTLSATNIAGGGAGITGLTATQIPTLAISKTSGLQSALDAKQAKLTASTGINIDANNYITATATSQVWSTDGYGITYTAGNVGIGAASVSQVRLYVSGDTYMTGSLYTPSQTNYNCSFSRSPGYPTSYISTQSGTNNIQYDDGTYKWAITSFTHTSGTQTSYSFTIPKEGYICDILLVAGGGCGGRSGGGGGAVLYKKGLYFPKGDFGVKVGNGAISTKTGAVNNTAGASGNNSTIFYGDVDFFRARGGGAGAANNGTVTGGNGGSGGGSENIGNYSEPVGDNVITQDTYSLGFYPNIYFDSSSYKSPDNSVLFGNRGGKGDVQTPQYYFYLGGGGGGAGGVGGNGDITNKKSGAGGAGVNIDMGLGTIMYGSGGSGGVYNDHTLIGSTGNYAISGAVSSGGGSGAYADGTQSYNAGVPVAGRGGGGGGWSTNTATGVHLYASDGGSGIVIIKYRRISDLVYRVGNVNNLFTISASYSPSERPDFVISNAGNIGIGTSDTNDYKLKIVGTMTATGTKNWQIKHPILKKKYLIHTCIEGTRADNIYRGRKQLINGECVVNIDLECNTTGGMYEGTFELINKNVQTYVINNETYDRVVGKIDGNKLTIKCENDKAECYIDWLVIGERCDEGMINNPLTSSSGSIIVESDNNID